MQSHQINEADYENLQHFRSLLDYMNVGVVICKSDGSFIDINEPFCSITGYSRDELLQTNFQTITHPDDLESDLEKLKQLMEGTISNFTIEKRYVHKTKTTIWVKLYVFAVLNKTYGSKLIIGTVQDITEQKNTLVRLDESANRITSILENISDAFVSLDVNWCYTYMNKKAGEIFGRDPEKMFGKHIWTEFPEGIGQIFYHTYYKAMETQQFYSIEEYYPPWNKWFENRIYPSPQGLSIFFTDITERKKTEQHIQALSNRLNDIVSAVPDIIMEVDSNRIYTWANSAGYEFFGDDVIGKEASYYFVEEQETYQTIKELFNGPSRIIYVESLQRRKDGEPRLLAWWCRNITDDEGRSIGAISTARDITDQKNAQETLRHSEEKFHKAFSSGPDCIIISSLQDGRYIEVNESFLTLSGFSREEIIGKSSLELNIWNDQNDRVRFVDLFQKEGRIRNFEALYRTKNGKTGIVSISAESLQIGNEKCILALSRDITEQKKTEETLRISEEKFSRLFSSSPDSITLTRFTDATLIEVNDSFCQFLGYQREELMGKDTVKMNLWVSKNERQRYIELLNQNKKVTNFEAEFLTKSGEIKTGIISAELINLQDDVYTLSIVRDITERKHAEEVIKKAIFELKSLYDNLNEAIFSYDVIHDRMLQVSIAHHSVFGYPPAEFFKNPKLWIELVVPEDRHLVEKSYMTGENGNIHQHEVRIRRADGQLRWVLAKMNPVLNKNGKITHIDGIVSDITERKQAEEALIAKNQEYQALNEEYSVLNEELAESLERVQLINEELKEAKDKAEESDRLKTAFLQNMSHEIRTPMNAIMGFSDLLDDHFENKEKLKKYSTIIKQRSSDLLQIINDILEIARIESGQLPVHLEVCDLPSLFNEVEIFFEEYRKRINKQHVDFKLNLQCSVLEQPVIIDQIKLKQILINLLNNAFKFTASGKVELGCSLNKPNTFTFYVSDTGIGIPANKQTEIFDRFNQAFSTNSENYGGTGLGLSIVKGILNLLGGEIWIESEPGKGSTFFFTFPFQLAGDKTKPSAAKHESQVGLSNLNVLVVEDDRFNSEYLKELLARDNYSVLFTTSGREAVDIACREEVDLILMDIRLPDITGYEATRLIKARKPQIKIIAQTAYASPSDKQKALEAGCDEFISKPVSKVTLFGMIQELMFSKQ